MHKSSRLAWTFVPHAQSDIDTWKGHPYLSDFHASICFWLHRRAEILGCFGDPPATGEEATVASEELEEVGDGAAVATTRLPHTIRPVLPTDQRPPPTDHRPPTTNH